MHHPHPLDTLDRHRALLDVDMRRITDVLASDPTPEGWVGLSWDSTVGLNEAALEFYHYEVPRLARREYCRRILTELRCDDALWTMRYVEGLLRRRLGLLLTSANMLALSMVLSPQSGATPTTKFYFDIHRADEYRDGDQIYSQRDTTPAEIFQLMDDLCDHLAITRVHSGTNQVLAEYGLRPVLFGVSIGPSGRKATIYHSLDDRSAEERYQVVNRFLNLLDRDDYRQAVDIMHEIGAVPACIGAYASPNNLLDAKIDFRFVSSSLPHHQRLLEMRLLTNPAIRDWLQSGVSVDYLGIQMNRQGKIRLKFYRF